MARLPIFLFSCRGWSALHQACIENHVCSHEETIRVLVHYHQLDLFQHDMNGKLAVEHLFCFEGGRPRTPSGSKEKEGLLMDQRKDILTEVIDLTDVAVVVVVVVVYSWPSSWC